MQPIYSILKDAIDYSVVQVADYKVFNDSEIDAIQTAVENYEKDLVENKGVGSVNDYLHDQGNCRKMIEEIFSVNANQSPLSEPLRKKLASYIQSMGDVAFVNRARNIVLYKQTDSSLSMDGM